MSGRFFKDEAEILAIPVTEICNLFIKLSRFPNNCKLVNLSYLQKRF